MYKYINDYKLESFEDIQELLNDFRKGLIRFNKTTIGETLWWAAKPSNNSQEALEDLSAFWGLRMPSGVNVWDSKTRLIILNDNPEVYFGEPWAERNMTRWHEKLRNLGIRYFVFYRAAKDGGSCYIFQLPRPKNQVEKKMEEVAQEVIQEIAKPVKKESKIKRNMKRKNIKEININSLEDDE